MITMRNETPRAPKTSENEIVDHLWDLNKKISAPYSSEKPPEEEVKKHFEEVELAVRDIQASATLKGSVAINGELYISYVLAKEKGYLDKIPALADMFKKHDAS